VSRTEPPRPHVVPATARVTPHRKPSRRQRLRQARQAAAWQRKAQGGQEARSEPADADPTRTNIRGRGGTRDPLGRRDFPPPWRIFAPEEVDG
jgi:hypothetical protein